MAHIVVAGALANKPLNGGEAWVRLSWVIGLARLGFTVHFVEQIEEKTCCDENGQRCAVEESIQLKYFREVTRQFGIHATLVSADRQMTWGELTYSAIVDLSADTELLVNISGNLSRPELLPRMRRKAYIDLDPGYTQIWHAKGQLKGALAAHDVHFTVGQNIGAAKCNVPVDSIQWRRILPPVVLDFWPVVEQNSPSTFTSVARWRGAYGTIEWNGEAFGMKCHEFRKIAALPLRCDREFRLALDIHPSDEKDRVLLQKNGWRIDKPRGVAGTPTSFRDYVQSSSAEVSAAQGVYVHIRTGWFSDRTAHYLASGRPALVQETGLSRDLCGIEKGLLTFSTLEQAIEGVDRLMEDYAAHQRAARAFAEAYLDSDMVLGKFLEQARMEA